MRGYTNDEKEYLRSNYSTIGCDKCAEFLNKNSAAVRGVAKRMGLKNPFKEPKPVKPIRQSLFSETEIDFIRENYPKFGSKVCADALSKKRSSIVSKANDLGIYLITSPLFTFEQEEFIKENYPKYGVKLCAEFCGKPSYSIVAKAQSLGIRKENYTKEQDQFILDNYPTLGPKICAEYCNKKLATIVGRAQKLGVKVEYPYSVDISQFHNIEKREVAYLLGLIWADGSIQNTKGSYRVDLEIVKKDIDEIEHLFDSVGNFLKRTRPKRGHWQEIGIIGISDKSLHSFLVENDYNIKSGASPDKILSKIPKNLQHYWWRGYLDGDGHIHVGKQGAYRVVFASCYDQDWTFLYKLFSELELKPDIKNSDQINKKSGNRNRSSDFYCGGRDGCLKLLSYIYNGYEDDKIGFTRKYSKFLEMKDQVFKYINHKKNAEKCPVLVYDADNNYLCEYPTIKLAAKTLNINYHTLASKMGRHTTCPIKGFYIRRKQDVYPFKK